MTIVGIDVSHWQATSDYAAILPSMDFFFAKATQDTTPDAAFATHIAYAKAHNVPIVGGYHFGTDDAVPAQLAAYLGRAGKLDGHFLDIEGVGTMTAAEGKAFIAGMHAAGKRIGLYASDAHWPGDWGQDWNFVANYSQRPTHPFDLWQFGPAAHNVDGDRYEGTLAGLQSLFGLTTSSPNQPAGDTMKLLATPTGQIGTAVVKTAGVQAFDADGVLIPLRAQQVIPLYGSMKLKTPVNPQNAANLDVWVTSFSGVSAYVLKVNVTPTLTALDCTADVAKAVAPLEAKIKAAQGALA